MLMNFYVSLECGRETTFEKGRRYTFMFGFDGHVSVIDNTTGNYLPPECLQQVKEE